MLAPREPHKDQPSMRAESSVLHTKTHARTASTASSATKMPATAYAKRQLLEALSTQRFLLMRRKPGSHSLHSSPLYPPPQTLTLSVPGQAPGFGHVRNTPSLVGRQCGSTRVVLLAQSMHGRSSHLAIRESAEDRTLNSLAAHEMPRIISHRR